MFTVVGFDELDYQMRKVATADTKEEAFRVMQVYIIENDFDDEQQAKLAELIIEDRDDYESPELVVSADDNGVNLNFGGDRNIIYRILE